MLNKIILNQVKKLIKEHIGLGDNKWEIKKIQNDIRNLNSKISRLEKKIKDA